MERCPRGQPNFYGTCFRCLWAPMAQSVACVHLDAGVSPKCIFKQCVNHTNSGKTAYNFDIVQECKQQFPGLNCRCTASRAGCWPRENKRGIIAHLDVHPHLGPPHAQFPFRPPTNTSMDFRKTITRMGEPSRRPQLLPVPTACLFWR